MVWPLFQDEGWKLNRNHYYQEGWLSTANLRGVVGVTYTTSHCGIDGASQLVPPTRTNYNLRGHRAEVGNIDFHSTTRISFPLCLSFFGSDFSLGIRLGEASEVCQTN